MILPGTTYKTKKNLRLNGTIHFNAPYSESFEFDLPKETEFKISYWTEPFDDIIQIWLLDFKKFENQIVPKEIIDSQSYDSYNLQINRIDIETDSILTYDFSSAIYFYSSNDKFGAFSNFADYGIDINGLYYPTVEHYYQSQKFDDLRYSEKIRKAKTAKDASILGKNRDFRIKSDWDSIKDNIMFIGIKRKFEKHSQLKDLLIGTGDKVLIENSPYDEYWGIGKTGEGLNKLGIILMRIREIIKNAA